jgi:hypothetical protein
MHQVARFVTRRFRNAKMKCYGRRRQTRSG